MKQKNGKEQLCQDMVNFVISLYLFVMLGFFPLYYKYQYAGMGDAKYKIFLYATVICVVVFFLLKILLGIKGKDKIGLDTAVFVYFVCTLVSFLLSPYKETGFWGSDGWSMGFLSQFLFIAIYFIVAKWWNYKKWVLWLLMVSSAMVFLVAVFHRFDVDILNIYGDLDQYYKVLFLSTMGQSSWYSSFLCTVFPIGLYLFFISENKNERMVSGMYSVIAMCSLVTQNTDSAFLSLAAVVILLLYISFDEAKSKNVSGHTISSKQMRWMQTGILILASFCFMGLCQKIFSKRRIPLDKLSEFMSQSAAIWVLLAVFVIGCLVLQKKKKAVLWKNKTLYWILLGCMGIGILGMVIFIIINTNGWLLEHYGYQSTNNYLLFDTQWGNGRGFAWQFAVSSFAEFPFFRQIIGVGPDCFSAHIKNVPQYLDAMQAFWGDLVLTNAHNEYLTKLYNVGIVGLVSYVGMLVTAIGTFLKYRHEDPLLPAFALCVVSYMVHNIFCYEQVCCTPIFYIIMGMGSNRIHNRDKKSTY